MLFVTADAEAFASLSADMERDSLLLLTAGIRIFPCLSADVEEGFVLLLSASGVVFTPLFFGISGACASADDVRHSPGLSTS